MTAAITTVFDPPTKTDAPKAFGEKAHTMMEQLNPFAKELNAFGVLVNGALVGVEALVTAAEAEIADAVAQVDEEVAATYVGQAQAAAEAAETTVASLGASGGSALVEYDGSTVKSALDLIVPRAKDTVDYFNMSRNGADKTGVNLCDAQFLAGAASGKPIYFSKGTYRLSIDELTTPVQIVGDGQGKVTIYLENLLELNANFEAVGVKFVLGSTYCASQIALGNYPTMFYRDPAAPYIDEIDFQACGFDFDSTAVARFIIGFFWKVRDLRMTNKCKPRKGSLRLHFVDYYDVSGNDWDMQDKNPEWECVHAVYGYEGGDIKNNCMRNSLADFIDVYPSTGRVVIEGNRFSNGKFIYITAKTITSNSGDPEGGSNLTGSLRNIIVRNNFFTNNGAANGVPYIDIGMYDRRTTKVPNDYQYYSNSIAVYGNVFDESDITTTGKQSTIVQISGVDDFDFTDNRVILSADSAGCVIVRYDNSNFEPSGTVTSTDKTSRTHTIARNNVKSKKTYTFAYIENPISTLRIKDNELNCDDDVVCMLNAVSAIDDLEIENNPIRHVVPSTVVTGTPRTIRLSTNAKKLTVKGQKLGPCTFGASDSLTFEDCEIDSLMTFSGNAALLIFKEARFTSGEVVINSGVSVTLVLQDPYFLPPKSYAFVCLGTISKYYRTGGVFLKSGGSIWAGSTARPAVTDDSAKFA